MSDNEFRVYVSWFAVRTQSARGEKEWRGIYSLCGRREHCYAEKAKGKNNSDMWVCFGASFKMTQTLHWLFSIMSHWMMKWPAVTLYTHHLLFISFSWQTSASELFLDGNYMVKRKQKAFIFCRFEDNLHTIQCWKQCCVFFQTGLYIT